MVVCLCPRGHHHGGLLGLVMEVHVGALGQGYACSHLRASSLPLPKMAAASSRAKVLLLLPSPQWQATTALQPFAVAATAAIKKN